MAADSSSVTISLGGQVAVVSGGSRGIGAATVKLLARAGARVAFSFHRNLAAAEAVVAACAPGAAVALEADAAQPQAGDRLVTEAVERFGRLDIAVANAGEWPSDDTALESIEPERWQHTLAVNLSGTYALARAALRVIQKQAAGENGVRGRVIAVASTAGQRGEAWHCDYGAAKGGVIALVRGLAAETAGAGVLVNCVAPGWVATDMAAEAMRQRGTEILQKIPLGRLATAEEIAGCILFLCSRWSDFMTGSVLSVNGGAVMA